MIKFFLRYNTYLYFTMLWYFVSIAGYLYQTITRFYKQHSNENLAKIKQSQKVKLSTSDDPFTGENATLSRRRRHRRLNRKMSYAGGIDGNGQSIAILTSGGDSQGMNAAIRATVRMGLYAGAKTFVVYWGYQGLVDGGENIKEISWDGVHGIIHKGGTVIGSARCNDFRTRAGRKKAAYNLVMRGITNLVVIGGDGSLTGASLFRSEWKSLVNELQQEGKISFDQQEEHSFLSLVGMVGSIDNDFCGTDMTIGADSALHRIVEAVDAIATTAESHQRAFVLEVMGRNCGYLALIAGISSCADWVFLPEWPNEAGWEEEMCDNLKRTRDLGRLLTIIIIAEGAQDIHGKPITANQVKELLTTRLKFDTRVTVLGHIQRGGIPSAFDRLLASRCGAEAALSVIEMNETSESYVMCLDGQQIVRKPLHQCVDDCNEIKNAYEAEDFAKVVQLRGLSFQNNLNIFKILKHVAPPICNPEKQVCKKGYTLAVMTIGAPAAGMNAAASAFTRAALYHGHTVLGIMDGFDGLMNNQVKQLEWVEVDKWTGMGGSNLGVTRTLPEEHFDKISSRMKEHNIQALLIIGGFEGFHGLFQLTEARTKYNEFCIPMVLIPATMSNNVPGTWFSLGADTTLNCIVECCDRLRQSAGSSVDRVYIVETMGGKCGYLATIAGIAGGADAAYTYEDSFTLADLKNNVDHLIEKFKHSHFKRGLILRTEHCNPNYTTDFINRLYTEEGKGVFSTRTNVLGHMQQGSNPSPFDRLCGTRQAVKAFNFLIEKIEDNTDDFGLVVARSSDSSCVLGHIKNESLFTPTLELKDKTDFKNRLPTECWWNSKMLPLLRVLAHYEVIYNREDGIEE